MFGIARLRGEEREKAIAEPGLSWKEWALTTGLKPWFALLLLILDSFVLASLIEVPELTYRVVALVLLLPIVYSNVVAYLYLWARPPANLRHASKFHPTLLHPFLIGRLQPDREEWVKGSALEEATAVPPEEFV